MQPIGIMMIEHRLMERMFGVMRRQGARIRETQALDGAGIDLTIGFIRIYVDRSHHGKEEEILFKPLREKNVPRELKELTSELVAEHDRARRMLAGLESAVARSRRGEREALGELAGILETFPAFYAMHIEKEDRRYFFPAMDRFTREEQDAMIEANNAYDLRVFHDVWRERVAAMERETG